MTKTAVLIFEDGGIQVVKGVYGFEVVARYENNRQHKYITLNGTEHNYTYVDTFFTPVKNYMFFENENDIVYNEDGVCIGYKTIKLF